MVKQIKSKAEFDAVLASAGNKLVVVDFTATWCGPCKMIAPFFEQLSAKHEGQVVCIKVDVDEVANAENLFLNKRAIRKTQIVRGIASLSVNTADVHVKDLCQECGIRSMPTFQFYKNGKKVDEFSGANQNKLEQKVAELM